MRDFRLRRRTAPIFGKGPKFVGVNNRLETLMSLENDTTAAGPPSCEEFVETAKEVSGVLCEHLPSPERDMPTFVLVASARENDMAPSGLPIVDDEAGMVQVATRWLPDLLLAHQATACVLVQPVTASRADDDTEGGKGVTAIEEQTRRLWLSAYSQNGDIWEYADIEQGAGMPPRIGAWNEASALPNRFEMWANAIHAALGRYDLDAS